MLWPVDLCLSKACVSPAQQVLSRSAKRSYETQIHLLTHDKRWACFKNVLAQMHHCNTSPPTKSTHSSANSPKPSNHKLNSTFVMIYWCRWETITHVVSPLLVPLAHCMQSRRMWLYVGSIACMPCGYKDVIVLWEAGPASSGGRRQQDNHTDRHMVLQPGGCKLTHTHTLIVTTHSCSLQANSSFIFLPCSTVCSEVRWMDGWIMT